MLGVPPLSKRVWLAGLQEPRLLLCPLLTELKATGTAHFFNFLLNTTDYRILLKDEDHDRMYVGSKDYVLSLDLHDINREPLIVRASPVWGGGGRGMRAPGLGALSGRPSDPHLWQIHWAASPQRIEECVLSGKDGNVSAVGPTCGVGGPGDRGPQESSGARQAPGHLLGFSLAPG